MRKALLTLAAVGVVGLLLAAWVAWWPRHAPPGPRASQTQRLSSVGSGFGLTRRLLHCQPHIGPWVAHEPVAVWHPDQR